MSLTMSATATSAAPSAERVLDEALSVLAGKATEFARLPVAEKAQLLRDCIPRLVDAAPAWVAAGCKAKGLSLAQSGEEWLAGPSPTVRMARLLARSLDQIATQGRPDLGTKAYTGRGGRLHVDVFPASLRDRALFSGITGSVMMQEGIDRAAAIRRQAAFYQKRDPEGGVSLVLGAGNVSSIPPMDVFTCLFIDGNVTLLKMNPVNEWVGEHLERALAPLIARGYLRIVYGGAEVGAYLTRHAAVDHIHITGSDKTHDLIVWGPPGPERERRLAENDPLLQIPITSELGNVSPVAIVPFEYSASELRFQARNAVTMLTNNASFNCNAAKMLITSKQWRQRDEFLELVGRLLADVPARSAYYPGAFDRYDQLVGGRDGVRTWGQRDGRHLPWTLLPGVDSDRSDDPLFSTEPFCAILSETSIGTGDPVEFLASAADFMNDRLWGTLNACLVIHPELERDAAVGRALDQAIVELRYGTVAINHWPAVSYGLATLPWGGHESANLRNIQSGLGWVHNTFMLDGIDKAVLRGPLEMWPKPPWFFDFERGAQLGPRLVALEAASGWRKVPGVALQALRG